MRIFMQTKKKIKLESKSKFYKHIFRNSCFGLIAVAVALYIGMFGYHWFEKMSWVDSFVNAAMILSGMGPVQTLATDGGKIFAGMYALFSGLAFIVIMGVMLAPILHRFFRKVHMESKRDSL